LVQLLTKIASCCNTYTAFGFALCFIILIIIFALTVIVIVFLTQKYAQSTWRNAGANAEIGSAQLYSQDSI